MKKIVTWDEKFDLCSFDFPPFIGFPWILKDRWKPSTTWFDVVQIEHKVHLLMSALFCLIIQCSYSGKGSWIYYKNMCFWLLIRKNKQMNKNEINMVVRGDEKGIHCSTTVNLWCNWNQLFWYCTIFYLKIIFFSTLENWIISILVLA